MLKNQIRSLLFWWLVFSSIWGIFRLLNTPEYVSELIVKPIIWLGITSIFIWLNIIPATVLNSLKHKYLQTKPFLNVFVLPTIFIIIYFFFINFRVIEMRSFSWWILLTTLVINFATGVVEEIVYRGIMYVWLLEKKGEVMAFILVQVLFLFGHLPTLIINSHSLATALSHAFFIVLLGSIHTGILD